MSGEPTYDDALDAFIREASEVAGEDAGELLASTFAVAPVPPPPGGLQRLLGAVGHKGRFARFADAIAAMIDVPRARALAFLDGLVDAVWEPGPVPGCELLWVGGGESVRGYVRGFVRLPAGARFPHHTHLGDEDLIVLQGAILTDTGERIGVGERATMPEGSGHDFAAADGVDLLYFTTVRGGVMIGDVPVLHRDDALDGPG